MAILFQGDHTSDSYGFPDGVAAKDRTRYGQVPDPLGVYDKVWHVQVRPGDNNVQGSGTDGERCEGLNTAQENLFGKEGRTHYWAVDVVFGNGYAPNQSNWNSFWQWHNTGTSGATCDFIAAGGKMLLQAAGDTTTYSHLFPLMPEVETMRRYELVVKWVWSTDPAVGGVQVWRDGLEALSFTHAATLYPGQFTYPKLGNYRTAQNFVADLYYHGYRCATTFDEAAATFTKSTQWTATHPSPPPDVLTPARLALAELRASDDYKKRKLQATWTATHLYKSEQAMLATIKAAGG